MLDEARALVFKDLPLPPNVPGGMADFRQVAAASFLFKFFVEASLRLNKDLQVEHHNAPPHHTLPFPLLTHTCACLL